MPCVRFAQVVTTTTEVELADECRVLVAESELARGKRDAARTVLAKVTHPTQLARARYLVAQSLLAEGKAAEAARLFAEVATLPGADALAADALFAAGETELQRGEFALATASLEALLAKHPKHARVTRAKLYLGECFVRAGRSAEALPLLSSTSRRMPRATATRVAPAPDSGSARRSSSARTSSARSGSSPRPRASPTARSVRRRHSRSARRVAPAPTSRARPRRTSRSRSSSRIRVGVPRALLAAGKTWLELGQREKADRVLDELIEKHPKSAEAAAAKPLRLGSHQR